MRKLAESSRIRTEDMAVGKLIAALYQIVFFYAGVLFGIAVVLVLILELITKWWPKCRPGALAFIAWALNVTILIGLCLLATCALLFATA